MECDVCNNNSKELFPCDSCKVQLCKTCACLTSSEVKVLQLRDRIMLFRCKKCNGLDTITLLQNTIGDKANIIESKDEIIALLKEQIKELELKLNKDSRPAEKILYSQVVHNTKAATSMNWGLNNVPTLIIKPKRKQNMDKTYKDLKDKINPSEIKVGIKGTRTTANGNVIVKCQSRTDLENLKKEAERKLTEYDIQTSKMRKPRIRIVGYEGTLSNKEVETFIREQNQFIEERDELEITFMKRNKKNNHCVIFGECSPSLFHKFMSERKIFIGWERYSVYEDIGITRCFKCQEHYHKHDECTKKQTCEYCSGEHDIRDCQKSRKACGNCLKANDKFKLDYPTDHAANDPACHSYQYLINILRSKIDYGNT